MARPRLGSALFGLAAFVLSTACFAGANGVDSKLTRLSEQVSFKVGDSVPVYGYKVDAGNFSPNAQNKVSLTITTTVVDSQGVAIGGATSGFAFGDGDSFSKYCKAGTTSVTCSFGQLKSNDTIPSFFVWFSAPTAGAFVRVDGLARFAEQSDGAGGNPNSTTPSSFFPAGSLTAPPSTIYGNFVDVGTPATTQTEIKGGLSRTQTGYVIGTSNNAANQTTDLIKTTLKLPTVPLVSDTNPTETLFFTSLLISESVYGGDPNNCTNGAGFSPCFQTAVTIQYLRYGATTYDPDVDLLTIYLYIEPAAATNVKEQLINVYHDDYFGGTVGLPKCTVGGTLPCVEFLQLFKTAREVRLAEAALGVDVEIGGVLAVVKNNKNGVLGLR